MKRVKSDLKSLRGSLNRIDKKCRRNREVVRFGLFKSKRSVTNSPIGGVAEVR